LPVSGDLILALAILGSSKEDLMAIGEMDRVQQAQMPRAIFGDVSIDGDYVPDIEHRFQHTGSPEIAWGATLKRILRYSAVIVFHIGVNVDVWIDPLDFSNRGFNRKRLGAIKLGRDRVVRERRHG
jgi:hypothetical protein